MSEPGDVLADGLHAAELTFDELGFPVFNLTFGPETATPAGVQAFIGTEAGSPLLPTITGTPILNPSPTHPAGLAARIDLQGLLLDFSDLIPGLILPLPDLHFVPPGSGLAAAAETTEPVRVPLSFFGGDNHLDPGDLVTESLSPLQPDVQLTHAGAAVDHQRLLVDTGAQLSVISTAAATALGLDLGQPTTTITVQGVAGEAEVPGFTVDALVLPSSDGGTLTFTDVPIYVLDVAEGLDGLLGMNLFNTAASLLYDPFDAAGPSLELTFYTNPDRGLGDDDGLGALLQQLGPVFAGAFGGHQIPGFAVPLGQIDGQVFQDANGDGLPSSGEPGLADWVIQLDTHSDGTIDATTRTNANGFYSFAAVQPGSLTVRETLPPNWLPVVPSGVAPRVSLASGQTATGVDFANGYNSPPAPPPTPAPPTPAPPNPARPANVFAVVRPVRRRQKTPLLKVVVLDADTGQVKREFLSPWQKPQWQAVAVSCQDTDGDGVNDTVVLTGRRQGHTRVRLLPI